MSLGQQIKSKSPKPAAENKGDAGNVNTFNAFLSAYMLERKRKEKAERELLLPIKRVNSLPIVYKQRLTKVLFSDSKSVNLGFEQSPFPDEVPNGVVALDELPDVKKEDLKKDVTPGAPAKSASFANKTGIDDKDLDALNDLKKQRGKDFLKHKIGEKKLDQILGSIDPLGEESVEVAKKEKYNAKRRRCLLLFLLPLLLALLAWFVVYYQYTKNKEDQDPTFHRNATPAAATANSEPFEYVPPGKQFNLAAPLISANVTCDKVADLNIGDTLPAFQSSAWQQIQRFYLDKVREVMSSLGATTGAWLVTELSLDGNKIILYLIVLPAYYQVFPALVWLGFDFEVDKESIKQQIAIFGNKVLFEEIYQHFKIKCDIRQRDISDKYAENLMRMGVVYGQLMKSKQPESFPTLYKGIITLFEERR